MTNDRQLLIGQLAKEAGVKSDTVRFYEKQNLLPKPTRTAADYRVYDEAALKQLRFIKQAQALGFSLQEIKRILNLRGEGKTTCRCVLAIAEATLSETEAKLRELQAFRDALKQHVEQWRTQSKAGRKMAAEFCDLIESSAEPEAEQGIAQLTARETDSSSLSSVRQRSIALISRSAFRNLAEKPFP